MQYSMGSPEHLFQLSLYPPETQPVVRKVAKWDLPEHKIFVATCEHVTAEGYRPGKCFSTKGWQRICELFNSSAKKNWSVAQLKSYWGKMQMKHKLLFELLLCTGIEYHLSTGRIIAPEHWWDAKIKISENKEYAKFKDFDCSEIYDTYGKLFGPISDLTKYALSSSKLSQRGFDLGTDSNRDDGGDKLPINAEGTDSSDSPVKHRGNSSMNISDKHNGDERKFKHGKEKGKMKKYGAREVSTSLEQMISVGTDLASIARSYQKADMTVDEYVRELLLFGHVEEGTTLHMFALWFLRVKENRNSYCAAKTSYLRYKFIQYCFEGDNQSFSRKGVISS